MRNYRIRLVNWLVIFLLFGSLGARGPQDVNPSGLEFNGFTFTDETVDLQLGIPYGGVVELYLYNEAGSNVWRNRYVMERGEHSISLRRSAFRPGHAYSYRLTYKLSVLSGDIPSVAV